MKKILIIGNALIDQSNFTDLNEFEFIDETKKGITIEKAYKKIKKNLKKQSDYTYAIISFGSNESEYVWHHKKHDSILKPQVEVKTFGKKYDKLLKLLSKYEIKPILLTTPKIDKDNFYQWILSQVKDDLINLKKTGTEDKLYQTHALYDKTIIELHHKHQTEIIYLEALSKTAKNDSIYLNQDDQLKLIDFIKHAVKKIIVS